jgi:Tol biopolymer transport system component
MAFNIAPGLGGWRSAALSRRSSRTRDAHLVLISAAQNRAMMLGRRIAAGAASLAAALALALLTPSAVTAAAGDNLLVSRATGIEGAKGNGGSLQSSISADGRFVAFESAATNLDPADTDATFDIFVRDTQTSATTLVSRAGGPTGRKSDGVCSDPDISGDGRYVAFRCSARTLHPADTDTTFDVFVRDLQANTTTLVSRADGAAGAKGNGNSVAPSISADGRYVAFESVATNISPADTDATADVFVRDLHANATALVSRAPGVDGVNGNGDSTQPSISSSGRYVAFSSLSTNVHADDLDAAADVFVRDIASNVTTLVSRAATAAGVKGDGDSTQPGISPDGRWVAFISTSTNLDAADADAVVDVYVRGLSDRTSTTTLVSRADGPNGVKGDGASATPTISTTGRYVAFSSGATNLDPGDGDAVSDIYSRELPSNNVRLLSRAPGVAGVKGGGDSGLPAISADARFVTFGSTATNLGDGDADVIADIHVRDVLGARPPFTPPSEAAPPASRAPAVPRSCPFKGTPGFGTNGPDRGLGAPTTDIFLGLGGNDVLYGFAGNDCLYGQQGNDRLSGGRGTDRLFGGPGADRLHGGPGADLLSDARGRDRFSGGTGNDRIDARDRTRADRRRRDVVSCGAGRRDRAVVNRADRVRRDCERVVRRR